MYFCSECKRKHRPSSSIYNKHLKLKKVKVDDIPSDKVIYFKLKSLSWIAQRQINQHLNKIHLDKKYNFGRWKEVYIK